MNQRILEAAARAAHECNRALSMSRGARYTPSWEQMNEADRAVVYAGVARVKEGLSARELHEAWVSDMARAGWVHGDHDIGAQRHPCLVSWQSLPPAERAKDYLFAAVVRAMLQAL